MKWFTREWIEGSSTATDEEVAGAYRAHLQSILAVLPKGAKDFAISRDARMSVHDGLVDDVTIDLSEAEAELRVLTGNDEVGFAILVLRLIGFELLTPHVDEAMRLLADRRTQFAYDEVDVLPDERSPLEVRFIMFPDGEIHFACATILTTLIPEPPGPRRQAEHRVRILN